MDSIYRPRRIPLAMLAAILGTLVGCSALAQTSTEPLLQLSNLVYQGSFRLPQMNCGSNYACFSYGGTALTYDAADNSLYVVGDPYGQLSTEISIPAVVNTASLNALNTASLLQPFADPTNGERNLVNTASSVGKKIGGQLIFGGKLIVSVYSYYDANGTQSTSHFVASPNLSNETQVAGPFRVGTVYPGFVSGYMTTVPTEWQATFGGPAFTGNCCLNIIAFQSNGPSVSTFDPSQLGVLLPLPAAVLVGYPHSEPLGSGWGTQSALFNGTTQVTGVVFPPGTRSVLFFGRQGVGPFCYGEGTTNAALNGQPTGQGDISCYDPANGNKGVHAYPYVYQIWAYDANDLAAVKSGSKSAYQIAPYGVWTFHLPFESADQHLLGGTGFDPTNNLIYLSQLNEDANSNPIIHVFKVNGGLAVPEAPGAVQAQ
ncbi:MAG TPA: hypothetical protein VMU40_13915 [Steroidobacteraceae bacterium]|nr:hypothetical protein [Steroidobacteraceae bacterium]